MEGSELCGDCRHWQRNMLSMGRPTNWGKCKVDPNPLMMAEMDEVYYPAKSEFDECAEYFWNGS